MTFLHFLNKLKRNVILQIKNSILDNSNNWDIISTIKLRKTVIMKTNLEIISSYYWSIIDNNNSKMLLSNAQNNSKYKMLNTCKNNTLQNIK